MVMWFAQLREQRNAHWFVRVKCAPLSLIISIAQPFGGRLSIKPIPMQDLCPSHNEVMVTF